jgi:hypothetical protein
MERLEIGKQMAFDEFLIDAKLGIETTGRDESCATAQVLPYEPTTYSVLDRLADSGLITKEDHFVDYGSGKGRSVIYLFDKIGCHASGIELARKFHEKALSNLASYSKGRQLPIDFIHAKAQDFVLPDTANVLFFFNPFHFRTLKKVMVNVMESYRRVPRHIRLFVYYPQNAYIAYLSGIDEIMFYDEIDCTDLFEEEDDRNRIMIFDIGQPSDNEIE